MEKQKELRLGGPYVEALARERVYELERVIEKGLARDGMFEATTEHSMLKKLLFLNKKLAGMLGQKD